MKAKGKTTGLIIGSVGAGLIGLGYFLLGKNKNKQTEDLHEFEVAPATKTVKKKKKKTSSSGASSSSNTATNSTNSKAKTTYTTKLTSTDAEIVAKSIDKAVYNMTHLPRIVADRKQHVYDATTLMKTNLFKINSVSDYIAVNNVFTRLGFLRANKTLVTALFDTWGVAAGARKMITDHLLKIGLKNNSGKWSLSGFEPNGVYTTESTIGFCDREIHATANSYVGDVFCEKGEDIITVVSPSDKLISYPKKSTRYVG
jgi:hypothetical protein